MTPNDIRSAYLNFFKARGHAIVPSSSLVPQNDPTTLFTGSGMQPMIPYLLGKDHPEGTRITDSQKAFRSDDIEEVGDNRHTTLFEMLGNWSLGDYFKQEQLPWVFEFLTESIGLDPKRIYVTAFLGDEKNNLPRDTESVDIWKKLFSEKGITAEAAVMGSEADGYARGMKDGERIFFYEAKKNWWSRAGVPEKMPAGEPGGPDSEIFYEFTDVVHDSTFGEHCHPNCDCGRFLEIGNSVFMQYIKQPDGTFGLLPKQNVDFGGGLERITMAATNSPDIIAVCHRPILDRLEQLSGKKYGENKEEVRSFRIVADHMKAAVFLIADGVFPAKSDQGYFVRRLIRRSVQHADRLGIKQNAFASIVEPVALMYKDAYPEIYKNAAAIEKTIAEEEEQFRKTLSGGLHELDKMGSEIDAFMLFTTYGFPVELTEEIAKERGISLDMTTVKAKMAEHQALSRAGAAQKFAGGLADHSEQTVRYHTAHHILLKALQIVLGKDVHQRGSNITSERLRIDFSFPRKMTPEEIVQVEQIVNGKIAEHCEVIRTDMKKEDAEQLGAEREFGATYPDTVSVYSVGPLDNAFSIEFCGGPHVNNTSELTGTFKIIKEEATSAGVRRIKAVLE
ncbi:MAG: alanine--tRNA ligase [Candidatus Kaiserbacteria bacterium]|nr:alanine--tRNA ligase [Candidatus Kaiserbacteria bacterium]